jgi:hypothetical protein
MSYRDFKLQFSDPVNEDYFRVFIHFSHERQANTNLIVLCKVPELVIPNEMNKSYQQLRDSLESFVEVITKSSFQLSFV